MRRYYWDPFYGYYSPYFFRLNRSYIPGLDSYYCIGFINDKIKQGPVIIRDGDIKWYKPVVWIGDIHMPDCPHMGNNGWVNIIKILNQIK